MEDEWDCYLALVFGDVETLKHLRAANRRKDMVFSGDDTFSAREGEPDLGGVGEFIR